MNTKVPVGKKIRSLRESKQMEIEVLAERAQLPLEQVKAIEEDGPLVNFQFSTVNFPLSKLRLWSKF